MSNKLCAKIRDLPPTTPHYLPFFDRKEKLNINFILENARNCLRTDRLVQTIYINRNNRPP